MPGGNIIVSDAIKEELPLILNIAKSLDLDCEDPAWNQFTVARQKGTIVGIGRLRTYPECTEIATVGVVSDVQNKGIGSLIMKELIRKAPREVFVTCVIPDFFSKLGFQLVKQYPSVLQKKVDFCKSYDYRDDQVFVMKFVK